jgi:hypothetical protein
VIERDPALAARAVAVATRRQDHGDVQVLLIRQQEAAGGEIQTGLGAVSKTLERVEAAAAACRVATAEHVLDLVVR